MNRAKRQGGDTEIGEVEIIAHRGANREAPENSIPAFERALEIGVHGVELDVRPSGDGVPIVHHDAVLSDGGIIEELHLAQIQQRANVPTLEAVLRLIDGRCHVYVEIKTEYALQPAVGLLKARTDWCSVHSFNHPVALMARALEPRLTTGILLVGKLVDPAHAFHAAQATDIWQHADYIDRDIIAKAHSEGARVIAWTVNDTKRAKELAALGVDGICTDTPREMLHALGMGAA
jgi:glycerophosphoryl diester phosphodiesterase